jgi:5-methylcytosine-specific restriction endonuclease McrA
MSPLDGDAKPRPKSAQLARGQRRYRRKVASPKQWQAIIAEKQGPCRVCVTLSGNGHDTGLVQMHHIVSREDFGDDVADNIVPLHAPCHDRVTRRKSLAALALLTSLSEAEYAYAVTKAGEDYFERAYGVTYSRS